MKPLKENATAPNVAAIPPAPKLARAKAKKREGSGGNPAVCVRKWCSVIARVASSKLYAAVQQAWSKAPELQHPAHCCQNGHLFEPHGKNR